jgi:hypothetical protein
MDDEQLEELVALTAIYGEEAVAVDVECRCVVVSVQAADGSVAVRLTLPRGYPAERGPDIEVRGVVRGLQDDVAAELTRVAAEQSGGPCLFNIVARLQDLVGVEQREDGVDAGGGGGRVNSAGVGHSPTTAPVAAGSMGECEDGGLLLGEASVTGASGITVVHGEPLTDRKSTFQAHVARVHSAEDVQAVLAHLYANRKVARATHNIRAHRFRDARGAVHADNDDDGEDAAGGRLAQMIELMAADDVLVVVSRWYGGIQLGPDRFRHINNAARKLIEAQAWYADARRHASGGNSGGSGGAAPASGRAGKGGTRHGHG